MSHCTDFCTGIIELCVWVMQSVMLCVCVCVSAVSDAVCVSAVSDAVCVSAVSDAVCVCVCC